MNEALVVKETMEDENNDTLVVQEAITIATSSQSRTIAASSRSPRTVEQRCQEQLRRRPNQNEVSAIKNYGSVVPEGENNTTLAMVPGGRKRRPALRRKQPAALAYLLARRSDEVSTRVGCGDRTRANMRDLGKIKPSKTKQAKQAKRSK